MELKSLLIEINSQVIDIITDEQVKNKIDAYIDMKLESWRRLNENTVHRKDEENQ